MALVPIFHGDVSTDGQLSLLDSERRRRRQWLATLAGHRVEVIVRKVKRQRSHAMNAYLHAVVFPILAEAFGDDIEGTKWSLMGECFGWRRCNISGREVPIKPHTSDMSDEESKYFLDWVIPWALVKHDVPIPLPGEVAA